MDAGKIREIDAKPQEPQPGKGKGEIEEGRCQIAQDPRK